ncbi:amidase [Ferrovibrio sp.]|uniref:amidase n=1 Tax=Ferrovibrio sp. TaxID=1917215 RepID=UPI0026049AC8|nr:amidase [Ferrovibrio sp.]
MPIPNHPWQLSAADLHQKFRTQSLSPVVVAEAVLARIAALNPTLNAFVHLDAASAIAAAEASAERYRAGRPLGPLDGVPVSIKDSLLVGGMPATWGSRLLEGNVPAQDELPVARLRAAGAVLLGKTNVPEFTVQGYTCNLLFGATGNPWNPALTPGGSSGGAVSAVAAGLGPLALGTDGGGSTRRPAGHTGLVGLKPSLGRIARTGGFPEIYNDLEVIGLFGRRIEDVATMLCALSAPDPRDRHSLAFRAAVAMEETQDLTKPPRILYAPRLDQHPVDSGIVAATDTAADALRRAGCLIENGPLPFDIDAAIAALAVLMPTGLAMIVDRLGGPERITPALLPMYESGKAVSGGAYLAALNHATDLRRDLAGFYSAYDAILTPSTAAQPWPKDKVYPERIAGQDAGPRGHAVYTGWVNLAGLPGISLPAEPDANGMPIGIQLVGGFGSDALLLAIGRRYEAIAPWAERWPAIAG